MKGRVAYLMLLWNGKEHGHRRRALTQFVQTYLAG